MRITYMGTPEFAVAPLEALLNEGYEIAAVITAPDKPAGRGKKLLASPVKIFAEKKGLKLFQPVKLKDPDFITELKDINADLQVVVAFRMLPEVVWAMPPLGTINLHASLLPGYRGAAPINHAIINGEKITGLTTFFIDKEIDTGKIIFQEKMNIGDEETAGELHDRMMVAGAGLVVRTARAVEEGNVMAFPQKELAGDTESLKQAPKILKEDTMINWAQPAEKIYNLIRGLSPYPAAQALLQREDGETLPFKIYFARYSKEEHLLTPGIIRTDGKNFLQVAATDGFINITDLQQPGKKRMNVESFLRGFKGLEKCKFV